MNQAPTWRKKETRGFTWRLPNPRRAPALLQERWIWPWRLHSVGIKVSGLQHRLQQYGYCTSGRSYTSVTRVAALRQLPTTGPILAHRENCATTML